MVFGSKLWENIYRAMFMNVRLFAIVNLGQ